MVAVTHSRRSVDRGEEDVGSPHKEEERKKKVKQTGLVCALVY